MVRQAMICYMDCVHVGVEGFFFLTCPLFDFDFELRFSWSSERRWESGRVKLVGRRVPSPPHLASV